jgi:peptidoglycan/LPS O-acetylase OafA/YrhL
VAVGFSSIAFGLLFNRRLFPSFFGSLPLYVAAKVSYPLYLIHMALIPVTLSALIATVGLDTKAPAVGFVIFLPVFVAVSLVAALYLHVAIERPFLLIRDRLLSDSRPEGSEKAPAAPSPDLVRV